MDGWLPGAVIECELQSAARQVFEDHFSVLRDLDGCVQGSRCRTRGPHGLWRHWLRRRTGRRSGSGRRVPVPGLDGGRCVLPWTRLWRLVVLGGIRLREIRIRRDYVRGRRRWRGCDLDWLPWDWLRGCLRDWLRDWLGHLPRVDASRIKPQAPSGRQQQESNYSNPDSGPGAFFYRPRRWIEANRILRGRILGDLRNT